MPATINGVDPHKRSHTAVVLDEAEQIAAKLRVDAGPGQVDALLGWAPATVQRLWAIENANGLGRLLAQQLVTRGEVVIDVPATLSSRARKLSGHSGRKTDEHDARSVAIAAGHNHGLRRVSIENVTVAIGLLLDRRWQLVAQRQPTICQLHALLTELVPAGAATHLTSTQVLFLCTGNGARSQMAEALTRVGSGGLVEAHSAGSHPKALHRTAVRVMSEEHGIDLADRRSKHLSVFATRRFDYVISLCDRVREVCPDFPGAPETIHWSIPDPSAGRDNHHEEASYSAFQETAAELKTRIGFLLAVVGGQAPPVLTTPKEEP